MTALLLIAAVVLFAVTVWALCAHAGRLDDQAGTGNAAAPGSPGQDEPDSMWVVPPDGKPLGRTITPEQVHRAPTWPPTVPGRCNMLGPPGHRCDLPPHDDGRHEQDGCGWWEQKPAMPVPTVEPPGGWRVP